MDISKRQTDKRRLISLDPGMMYGKVPPQAKDLEEAILGSIMIHREAYDLISDLLKPECFYLASHQLIYKAFQTLQLKNSPIDGLTVMEQLRQDEELDLVGGPYALTQLTQKIVGYVNIEAHAKIVYQKFIQRELIRVAGEIINEAYEDSADAFELLGAAEKSIDDISIGANPGLIKMDAVLMQAVKKIEEWRQNEDALTGVPSGFHELDMITRGWQPGDLIILGARPSVGKTALALNFARNAAINDRKKTTVAFWSLEMKAIFLAFRMIAAESKIFLYRLLTGRLSDEDMATLMRTALNTLSKGGIYFDENTNINVASMSRKARKLKRKNKLGLIIIDYLQLMKGEEKKNGNREQDISYIARELKNLAQELDIPIIAMSQLDREKGSKNISWTYGPPLTSLRESGAIEQHADVVLMLWEPSDEDVSRDPTLVGRRKVRVVKQRNGLKSTIELDLKGEIQLFSEIESVMGEKKLTPVNIEKGYRFDDPDAGDDLPF